MLVVGRFVNSAGLEYTREEKRMKKIYGTLGTMLSAAMAAGAAITVSAHGCDGK